MFLLHQIDGQRRRWLCDKSGEIFLSINQKIFIGKHAKSLLHYVFVVGEHGKWDIRGIVQLLYCGLRQQEISLNLIFSKKKFLFPALVPVDVGLAKKGSIMNHYSVEGGRGHLWCN